MGGLWTRLSGGNGTGRSDTVNGVVSAEVSEVEKLLESKLPCPAPGPGQAKVGS